MKVIVVSQRIDFFPIRNEFRDQLDERLIEFLMDAGYLPVPVPNNLLNQPNAFDLWMKSIYPAAIILSGGNDIGEYKYRDALETALLSYAEKLHLPVLGICRGMQMMGVIAGAKLKVVDCHVNRRHFLIGDITREVNSYHKMVLTSCPHDYEVIAYSPDHEIEAIRHRLLPWEGWMWHPEREEIFSQDDLTQIRRIFGNC